ncbi:hypothetical protein NDU88_004799 [Pleurodeles waltl]|uniref:Uncharacterized protein n=1 Tax=Pleurodeles waltl TaxID=8319 RepID=A0AAV7UJ54_PLEWA|nr:hypothetical protein NDU88_004799 [Pleurodeles waltl]
MQGAGPRIPGRCWEEQTDKKLRREEQEEFGESERNKTEEETWDEDSRETGPRNGRQGAPTRTSPQED